MLAYSRSLLLDLRSVLLDAALKNSYGDSVTALRLLSRTRAACDDQEGNQDHRTSSHRLRTGYGHSSIRATGAARRQSRPLASANYLQCRERGFRRSAIWCGSSLLCSSTSSPAPNIPLPSLSAGAVPRRRHAAAGMSIQFGDSEFLIRVSVIVTLPSPPNAFRRPLAERGPRRPVSSNAVTD